MILCETSCTRNFVHPSFTKIILGHSEKENKRNIEVNLLMHSLSYDTNDWWSIVMLFTIILKRTPRNNSGKVYPEKCTYPITTLIDPISFSDGQLALAIYFFEVDCVGLKAT